VRDHRVIINALQERNPTAASQAMLLHLNNVEQELKQMNFYHSRSTHGG
jgi:DNA-binding FadR family transcriptional regulator